MHHRLVWSTFALHRGHVPVEELLGRLPQAGIRAIDVNISGREFVSWRQYLLPEVKSLAQVRRFRRRADAAGVRIYGTHAPTSGAANLAQLDAEERQRAVAIHRQRLQVAGLLGAEVMVIHGGGRVAEEGGRRRLRQAGLQALEALIPHAADQRVRLAVELMPRHWVGGSAQEVASMVDRLASPWLGACLDTGHAHTGEGLVAATRRLGRRMAYVHWHDHDGETFSHHLPSEGIIDWQPWLNALRRVGYRGALCLEVEPAPGQPLAQRRQAVEDVLRLAQDE